MHTPEFERIVEAAERYVRQQDALVGGDWYVRQPDIPDAADDLAAYGRSICGCRKCALSETRRHFVFGTGNPNGKLMLIGEAPGEEEDLKGEPFVGKAGHLLDRILAAIAFERGEVYIANVLKCRPPRNRDPLPEEMAMCLPYLKRQIALVQPKLILLLGRVAAHAVLRTAQSLTQMRNLTHQYGSIPVLVTFHPAALLRNPQWKQETWEDVQKLRRLYDERVGDKAPWTPKKKS